MYEADDCYQAVLEEEDSSASSSSPSSRARAELVQAQAQARAQLFAPSSSPTTTARANWSVSSASGGGVDSGYATGYAYEAEFDEEDSISSSGSGSSGSSNTNVGVAALKTVVLPERIWVKIFEYVGGESLDVASRVCQLWQRLSKDRAAEERPAEKSLSVCDYWAALALEQIKEIKLKDKKYYEEKKKREKERSQRVDDSAVEYKPTDTRIDYLTSTISLIREYLPRQARTLKMQQSLIGDEERRSFLNKLVVILTKNLQETSVTLSKILEGKFSVNENFDIFELILRRYYEQLRAMFPPFSRRSPPKSVKPAIPSKLITDTRARLVWDSRIGRDKYHVDFETFYTDVICEVFPSITANHECHHYFSYFLNFPPDNMVTTYKWEVLTRLFGPFNEFVNNFQKYVLEKGFLGLVDRIGAEEQLKDHPDCVLLRFSRTYPTCLAFSFTTKDGKFDHYTNNPVWNDHPPFKDKRSPEQAKDNIPIGEFLQKLFFAKGYKLLPKRVDGKSVAEQRTMSAYASYPNPYLCSALSDEEEQATPYLDDSYILQSPKFATKQVQKKEVQEENPYVDDIYSLAEEPNDEPFAQRERSVSKTTYSRFELSSTEAFPAVKPEKEKKKEKIDIKQELENASAVYADSSVLDLEAKHGPSQQETSEWTMTPSAADNYLDCGYTDTNFNFEEGEEESAKSSPRAAASSTTNNPSSWKDVENELLVEGEEYGESPLLGAIPPKVISTAAVNTPASDDIYAAAAELDLVAGDEDEQETHQNAAESSPSTHQNEEYAEPVGLVGGVAQTEEVLHIVEEEQDTERDAEYAEPIDLVGGVDPAEIVSNNEVKEEDESHLHQVEKQGLQAEYAEPIDLVEGVEQATEKAASSGSSSSSTISTPAPTTTTIPYKELMQRHLLPAHIDQSALEQYLSDEEFITVFKQTRKEFYEMKAWKQANKKKAVGLF
ncbi:Villin headpiece domain containing protein [Balamuthia mandrillaris]